jgi:hypothetical protein
MLDSLLALWNIDFKLSKRKRSMDDLQLHAAWAPDQETKHLGIRGNETNPFPPVPNSTKRTQTLAERNEPIGCKLINERVLRRGSEVNVGQ